MKIGVDVKNTVSLDFATLRDNLDQSLLEFVQFKLLSKDVEKKYGLSLLEFMQEMTDEIFIPLSIFSHDPSPLEAICKFLKENVGLNNKKIANLLNRSSQSIWQAYNGAKKKHSKKYSVAKKSHVVPLSELQNKNLSVLENIVLYLKEKRSFTFHEIAVLLSRDDRTIWTVYSRAQKKIRGGRRK